MASQLTDLEMALLPASQPKQEQEDKRPSLLELVKERLQKEGKTTLSHRVIVCGEIQVAARAGDVSQFYTKFIKKHQGDNHEGITGVLFTYQSTFVHILEGSAKVIYTFLRDMLPQAQRTGGGGPRSPGSVAPVRNVKLLLFSDDIAQRYFSFWVGKAMEGEGQRGREVDEDALAWDEQGRTIGEMCVQLLSIGAKLSTLSKSELKGALEELTETYRDLIPTAAALASLCKSDRVTSVQEWHSLYHGESPLYLESELVWPAAKPLTV